MQIDLANSASLSLARKVDPFKRRTIGVVTKLDLLQNQDEMKKMINILSNKHYPLKLGFIGVYNMSYDDMQAKKSVEEVIKSQREFFDNHLFE